MAGKQGNHILQQDNFLLTYLQLLKPPGKDTCNSDRLPLSKCEPMSHLQSGLAKNKSQLFFATQRLRSS